MNVATQGSGFSTQGHWVLACKLEQPEIGPPTFLLVDDLFCLSWWYQNLWIEIERIKLWIQVVEMTFL